MYDRQKGPEVRQWAKKHWCGVSLGRGLKNPEAQEARQEQETGHEQAHLGAPPEAKEVPPLDSEKQKVAAREKVG